MRRSTLVSGAAGVMVVAAAFGASLAVAAVERPADAVYRNGYVYTVDAHDSVQQTIAVRQGRLVYVGSNKGVGAFIGPHTEVQDLHGRMLMPGLVDGHMHPLGGGTALTACNLNYERLDVAGFQARIQACLDATRDREPDGWLQVRSWFQEGMIGSKETTRATLDALHTRRPIVVLSSFYHTTLVNSRALELAHITAATSDPRGGLIERDASRQPTGILQDAAGELVSAAVPKPTAEQNIAAAEATLDALRRQGVTTILDAAADAETIAAFAGAQKASKLTTRVHFAVLIKPPEGGETGAGIAEARDLARRYDCGAIGPEPGLTVRNIKLFLDGVIAAPALTGAMLEPYFENRGTPEQPRWAPGTNRGPQVYFKPDELQSILLEGAAAGFDPHMHADGDRAVRVALDAIEAVRAKYPGKLIRAAIAHDEIVSPADLARFGRLDAVPVLSFQWERPAPDTVGGTRDYLGAARYPHIEPAGVLARAGARIAFGSDWPVDPLDEWFALKVGVTRANAPDAEPEYRGRLGVDPGLSRREVLRAITMNSSYELHQEDLTGSLEVGKLADFIVLDRNVMKIQAEDIAHTRVLMTVVGGRVVYEAGKL
jgi:predicted amidohydrolase YtcJ